MIGLFLKPFGGLVDFTTKILESIAISINDVLGDRVRTLARYQRVIKDNELKDFNSIDSLAYTIYKSLDTESINASIDEIELAVPGKLNNKDCLLLLTKDRIVVVDYSDDVFICRFQIYTSQSKMFSESNIMTNGKSKHLSVFGKRIAFMNIDGQRYLYIYFDAVFKAWYRFSRIKEYELRIKLYKFYDDSLMTQIYNKTIESIIQKYSAVDFR